MDEKRKNAGNWRCWQKIKINRRAGCKEGYFYRLVQNANAIVVHIDGQGRIMFMNDWGLKFYGQSAQLLPGTYFLNVIFPELEFCEDKMRDGLLADFAAAGRIPATSVREVVKPNGERTWLEWHIRLVKNQGGKVNQMMAVGFDYSAARRNMYLDPLVDQVKMQNLFDNMIRSGLYCKLVLAVDERLDDYVIVACNKSFEAKFRVTNDDKIRQKVAEIFFEIQRKRSDWQGMIRRIALEGSAFVFEQYLDCDKAWYSISVYSPEKFDFVVAFEDITKQKLLEEQKERIWGRYETLVRHSFDATIIVDPDTQTIVEVNQRLCQMTGYRVEELIGLNLNYVLAEDNLVKDCQEELIKNQYVSPALRHVNCKDGSFFTTERVATLIVYQGRILELITLHDISEEIRLQQKIKQDIYLAGTFQRQLLPHDIMSERIEIKSIYQPLRIVSGDFFDYCLSKDGMRLTGYLVDVAGHGLATALETAAIDVFLKDWLAEEKPPCDSGLRKINEQMVKYFREGSFAALLIFHFDLVAGSLTFASCGINWLLASCAQSSGWIKQKGSLMGVFHKVEFGLTTIAVQPGDSFYFLTDGLSERFLDKQIPYLSNYEKSVEYLSQTAQNACTDDCSAVCVRIRGWSNYFQFHFTGMDDVSTLHERIRQILERWDESENRNLEVVINEAINNVLLHGSGDGYLRLRMFKGRRIVIRVKDCKLGSDAGNVLQQYQSKSAEELLQMLTDEGGRGILLMKLFTDRIFYSQDGSEVLLVYKKNK